MGTWIKNPPGYTIVEYLGGGAMGAVYRAVQLSLERQVALKTRVVERGGPDQEFDPERLIREAKTIARLEHPNIIRVHDCFIWEGRIFLVMELLDGQTVAQILAERQDVEKFEHFLREPGKLNLPWTLKVGIDVSIALQHAHEKGIYHRDIKPSNIFITKAGEIKIIDFSIARDIQTSGVTMTGTIVGSPPYMSPEQIQDRPLDGRTDIYSLGCVLFDCLTGRKPFDDTGEIMICMKHLQEPAPDPRLHQRDCPDRLGEIILKCLQKTPEERYQTARDLADDLSELAQHEGIKLPGSKAGAAPSEWQRRKEQRIRTRRRTRLLLLTLVVSMIAAALYHYPEWSQLSRTLSSSLATLQKPLEISRTLPVSPSLPSGQETVVEPTHSPVSTPPVANHELWNRFLSWAEEATRLGTACDAALLVEEALVTDAYSVTLPVYNMAGREAELAYLVVDGRVESYYVDNDWSLKPVEQTLKEATGGSAFGEAPIIIGAGDQVFLTLGHSFHPGTVALHMELNDLRVCGKFTEDVFTSPPLAGAQGEGESTSQEHASTYAERNRLEAPIIQNIFHGPSDYLAGKLPVTEAVDQRLRVIKTEEAQANLAHFMQALIASARLGQLQGHLAEVQGGRLERGDGELLFQLMTTRKLFLYLYVVEGYQELTATDWEQDAAPQVRLQRPLNGLLLKNAELTPAGRDVYKVKLIGLAGAVKPQIDTLLNIELSRVVIAKALYFTVSPEGERKEKLFYRTIENLELRP